MEKINRVNHLKAAVASYNQLFRTDQDPITLLKRGQIESLYSIRDGKDTFIVLPTGYGKSLIFELILFYVSKHVMVLEPLNSIINQLEEKLEGHVVKIDKDTNYEVLEQQKFITGHPEEIINAQFYNKVSSLPWVQDHIVIVVDEAHLILQWQDNFRPIYKNIKHLRTIFKCITMCAMTATVSREAIKTIRRDLQMLRGNVVDSIPLLRGNISLNVRRRPGYRQDSTPLAPYEEVFKPLIEECLVRETFPLTIVYTKLIGCVKGIELAKTIMGKAFYDGEETNKKAVVVQYHSPQDEEVNKYIIKSIEKPDSHIKLIFATIALGMGADLKHVGRVIHAGPPSSIEDYILATLDKLQNPPYFSMPLMHLLKFFKKI